MYKYWTPIEVKLEWCPVDYRYDATSLGVGRTIAHQPTFSCKDLDLEMSLPANPSQYANKGPKAFEMHPKLAPFKESYTGLDRLALQK